MNKKGKSHAKNTSDLLKREMKIQLEERVKRGFLLKIKTSQEK